MAGLALGVKDLGFERRRAMLYVCVAPRRIVVERGEEENHRLRQRDRGEREFDGSHSHSRGNSGRNIGSGARAFAAERTHGRGETDDGHARQELDDDTRAAQGSNGRGAKQSELTPAGGGEAPVSKSAPKQKSTMTREKRKAETTEARKKGELVPAGGGSPAPSK